jgi:regulator of sigma E protease
MILSLITFLLVLGVLVFVHELGHFIVAKWVGMRVDEFAIGFPPRLFKYKRGETTYAINALPLGGYVKIHGENGQLDEGEDKMEDRSFNAKPVWARSAVLVAGVTMNLIFAFLILCVVYTVGFPAISSKLESIPGAVVSDGFVQVAAVRSDTPADKAGIEPGDRLVSLRDAQDGSVSSISRVSELQAATGAKQKEGRLDLEVEVRRDDATVKLPVTIAAEGPALGVEIAEGSSVRVPWFRSPQAATEVIGVIGGSTWTALKDFGSSLFRAELDPNISGPVGIYRATSAAAQEGFAAVIYLTVALSINLALLNILPIPVLDGGKLLFVFIEGIFRKRVIAMEIENGITSVAFVILIGLISIITLKDLGIL